MKQGGGGRSGSLILSREKEKDKDFMTKMLKKEKEKEKKKGGGGEDSDDSAAPSSDSSSGSSDEEDGGLSRRRSRAASFAATLTKSKKKTDVVKVRWNILLKLIVGLPSSANDLPVYVSWKRGRKRQNRGETKHIRSTDGVVMWGESVWLEATMAASSTDEAARPVRTASVGLKFDHKSLVLAIKREGKSSSLGKLTIDLAEFAADGTNVSKEYKINMADTNKKKKKSEPKEAILTVGFKAEWLKVNNKKLVRKGTLIQKAAPHVDATAPVARAATEPIGLRTQLGSMASLVGSDYELVTDSEAEYSENETDMTADTVTESDFSGSETDSDGEESDWEIDSKQVELKRENARLKQREKQLAALLDKSKKDIESKDRHILQLKVELEKKKERSRRIHSVATIMSDLGLAMDDQPEGAGGAKHASGSEAGQEPKDDEKANDGDDGVSPNVDGRKLELENQELRRGVSELRGLLEKKDEELTALNEKLDNLEPALRDKERDIKLLKKDVEKEKVQRIDLQINKEKDKLEEVERAINDKNEIKRLKLELRNKEKEAAALLERMAAREAEWKVRAEQYEHEIKSLSRTIENFGRTKW